MSENVVTCPGWWLVVAGKVKGKWTLEVWKWLVPVARKAPPRYQRCLYDTLVEKV